MYFNGNVYRKKVQCIQKSSFTQQRTSMNVCKLYKYSFMSERQIKNREERKKENDVQRSVCANILSI